MRDGMKAVLWELLLDVLGAITFAVLVYLAIVLV